MSLQLDAYLTARASGSSVEHACEQSGIGLGEAHLHEKAIESGELALPHVHVREEQPPAEGTTMANGNIAADELRLLIEQIERLQEERKGLADDIADVFKEAKNRGFDTWAMKECLKYRKLETHQLNERATLLELYMGALGMTPIEAEILKAA